MAVRTSSNHLLYGGWITVLLVIRAVGSRTCVLLLLGLSLAACRSRGEQALRMMETPRVTDGKQPPTEVARTPAARAPRTRARSHVLLGIDFSRPLRLPVCARYYNSFDRPDHTCVYLRSVDHRPFKIEFANGSAPDFLKWDNALVSTDKRGRPDMLRFDIDGGPAHRGKAVDAMLHAFGPPTSVENAAGTSKVGTWLHDDYVIRYFFEPGGDGIVQMETRKFHDAANRSVAAVDARNGK